MSVASNDHSSRAVSRKSYSHEDIPTASLPISDSTIHSEKGSYSEKEHHSGTSRKSSKSSQGKFSNKAFSEKGSLPSHVPSDIAKEKFASAMLSSESRSRGEKKGHWYPKDEWTIGGGSLAKSSSSDKLSNLSSLKSENGENRVDGLKEHGLSSDDLRKKLFSSFKSKGILNGAKIQIRADLASAINERQALKVPRKSNIMSFASKISDCIVAEHLKKSEYEYTLSVFKAESLLSEFDFHPHEVLDIMKLSPSSTVYENLSKYLSQERAKSFLWNFISEMVSGKIGSKISTECQTEEYLPLTSRDIDIKMLEIENDVMSKGRSGFIESSLEVEERLFDLQKKMEDQKKKELKIEKQKLKDELLRKVRLEEQEKNNAEFSKHKVELEKLYHEKFSNLVEKEKQMDLMGSQKRKQIEEEAYNQRQNLLEELKKIKERETDLQKQHELAMKSVNIEETRLRALAEELKLKEISQKTMEERYEIRFQEEILKFQTEQQQEKQKSEEFYRQQEAKLNEEKALFQSEKVSLMRYQKEFEALQYKNDELQASLHSSQQRVHAMSEKIDDMKEKMLEMADYPKLKENIMLKDKEIDYLKGSLHQVRSDKSGSDAQHRKDIKDLIDRLLRGTPDTAKLQQQILLERDEYLEKERELKVKCKEVAKRLQEEYLKNKEIMHMYEECLLQNKALKREIGNLKKPGGHRNIPLSGNLHHKTLKPFEYKKTDNSTHYIPFVNKDFHKKQVKDETFDIHKAASVPHITLVDKAATKDHASAPIERMQGTEEFAAFEKLEREAESLERMYHDFRASQLDKFARESDYEKPNTNEFKPLQKYESTLKQDFSKIYLEAEKDFISEVQLEENYGRKHSSSRALGYQTELVKSGDDFKVYKDSAVATKSMPQDIVLIDDNHLDEQLIQTAHNQSSKVNPKLDLSSKSDVMDKVNSFDKVNTGITNDIAKKSHGAVVSGDNICLLREGWKGYGSPPSFENNVDTVKIPEDVACNVETRHVSEDGEQAGEKQEHRIDSAKGHTTWLENEAEKELYSENEEENFGQNTAGSTLHSQHFKEEMDKEEASLESRDHAAGQSRARNEDINSSSLRMEAGDELILTGDGDNSLKSEKNGDTSNENATDDDIDPLMKHYMEMVMKKKTMTEKESEKEQLNLTDDTKIESKLSRSDISDLIEDNIEEIEIESGEEFDW